MAAKSPSEVLRKIKAKEKKPVHDSVRADKQGDDEHDEKMPLKGGKRSALIDFIAKNKKTAA